MWLVLCDEADASARWVWDGLRRRSVAVELVPTRLLSAALRWNHRIGPDGASFAVDLPDGRCVESRAVHATLNRVVSLSPPSEYAASPDGEYALQELLALYLSLLRCLSPPVLNPSSPQGLAGRLRYAPEWTALASRAGFTTDPFRVASTEERTDPRTTDHSGRPAVLSQTLLVAAGRLFGNPVAPGVATAACRLASLAGVDLLGVQVATTADGTATFVSADLYPDLRPAGDALLDHLATLGNREAGA